MIEVRPFAGLGHANHGWLDARHHFSFANYYDPARMSWGTIRVWNDDTIAAQSGFPPHSHSDMEIVTFVRSGAITHQDSLGNKGRTGAGDVQVMSAGSGITHAEYNLEDKPTTLFQIWIETDKPGVSPGWGQREFPRGTRAGRWEVLASGDPVSDAALSMPMRGFSRRRWRLVNRLSTKPIRPDTSIWLRPRDGSGSMAWLPSRAMVLRLPGKRG